VGATQKLLRFGVFELNLDTVELRKSGTLVKLPPQPFKLLVLLASHAGQIVTREEIEIQLWGDETQVDFEHGVNKCIKQIRTVLGDDADHPIYIETLPRQGYRFLAPVVSKTIAAPGPRIVESQSGERGPSPALTGGVPSMPATVAGATAPAMAPPQAEAVPSPQAELAEQALSAGRFGRLRSNTAWIGLAIVVLACAFAGLLYWRKQSRPALTEKDTIVVADFDNKTGDALFDDALKQGLAVQLEQSPFLALVPERRISHTLKLMGRAGDDRLTPEVALEICQRTGSAAVLTGSIATLGSRYVIGLKATECNGDYVLAETQTEAADREHVLRALDAAATQLRSKLGESFTSVQTYATPLEEATTPSLEALKAYSLGRKARFAQGNTAALPFFEQAVALDPNFAMPYQNLATAYNNLGEGSRAAENAGKAYALRDKVSQRERFAIDAMYYFCATGDLKQTAKTYVLWQQTYPRDSAPYTNLSDVYGRLGKWDKAVEQARQAMQIEPSNSTNYTNLGVSYVALNRLDEAEAIYSQAEERKLQGEFLLEARYRLAFLRGDTAQMSRSAGSATGKPGTEDVLLESSAETEAWSGKLKQARGLTQRAMSSALTNHAGETAATYQAMAALREAEMGNWENARAAAQSALKLGQDPSVNAMAALALARAGDAARAQKLAATLEEEFPQDTLVQEYWLPTVGAALALQHNQPQRAVERLQTASPIELSQPTYLSVSLCPVYLRGQAYLMLHEGSAAAAEFQKFLDNRGVVGNFAWGALARLGLARAYALDAGSDPGAREKARIAYQNFLTLWKDADPDLPIYKQAKAEYAKLQ